MYRILFCKIHILCALYQQGEGVHTKLPRRAEAVCLKCVHCHFAVILHVNLCQYQCCMNVNMLIRNSRNNSMKEPVGKNQHCVSIVDYFYVCLCY